MKEIPLSQGKVALVDDEDYLLLASFKWTASVHKDGRRRDGKEKWYAIRRPTVDVKRKIVYMHRFITTCPCDLVVDHLDGDGLNNQRANLQCVTQYENTQQARRRIVEPAL